ncbi:TATA-box-binding protein [Thermococcus sp. AM4]|uniref:TATA-box-binding protein n=1 Tax=Thermococcus sp. (strain AM4) TaxID=246969 RepID=UPI0001870742|nr:TATA-box-binding protein [Thermococcus sp. AM4]EEB72945.1 TATA-box binding protein [Thermococcus sp. AM4]
MPLEVENVVASIDLHGKIDVERVASELDPVHYDPSVFPGAIYKMGSFGVTFLIFYSGKLVCTGAKSVETIKRATEELKQTLESMGMKFRGKPEIRVQNIVAAGDAGFRTLDLDTVALTLPNVEYEPEIFPGVVYRVKNSRITILIFNSGKIVVSGAKTEEDIQRAVNELISEFKKYGLVGGE